MFFGAATVAVGCLLLFNPIWTTVRFSRLFGEFHSMQLAYDEPYYFWLLFLEATQGALDVNHRIFSKLLGSALLSMGASFDVMLTVYAVLNPLLAFAAALVLAACWEKRSLGRIVWAVVILFSFDFLSGSSRVIDYDPPAVWLAELVGNLALLKADVLSFFLIHRRPEPQSSWIVLFLYWALLLNSFLEGHRDRYLLTCAVTPLLAFIYINVSIAAVLVFVGLSLCNLFMLRQRIAWPFILSITATALAYFVLFAAGSSSWMASQTVFRTHMPMLRPSIALAVAGLVWAGIMIHRAGPIPARFAALVFFAFPVVALNQQLITGVAVLPHNWEIYANYPCIVVGAGLLAGNYLSSFERSPGWRQFLPLGLLAMIGFVVVQGALRNERNWLLDNVRSVLFSEVLARASAKVGHFDAVILPHMFDESLFLTQVPRGTVVLGGYNSMVLDLVPAWRNDQSFTDHAVEAGSHFATGFEVLFRSGVTPAQLQERMSGELATGDCWLGLSYFFWQGDCWPAMLNYTAAVTRRLPSAVPEIVSMYGDYLRDSATGAAGKRKVLLIRNEPLSAFFDDKVQNELVATAETNVDGKPVRAYGYLQKPKLAAHE
ncbi:MAG: hypothetical protein Q8L22_24030 [Reyranella sp.]|nr:hypothetical protein [Reyranella sp.]